MGIYQYARAVTSRGVSREEPFALEYDFLHRTSLISIQNELARCKEDIINDGISVERTDRLRRVLNDYGPDPGPSSILRENIEILTTVQ
jgi:hypothetical protein